MGRIEVIETLTAIGGSISVLFSLVIIAVTVNPPRYLWLYVRFSELSLWLVVAAIIAWVLGLVGGVTALLSYALVRDMPDRASQRILWAGGGVLTGGLLSPLNLILLIPSGLLLAAGILCMDLWERIRWARRQTGFPFSSVATAQGGPWHRRLSCRFCGAPLVVLSARARGPRLLVRALCPLDQTPDYLKLPLSRMEEWVPVLADRLHRCTRCGRRTSSLIPIRRTRLLTWLTPLCPIHHADRTTRKVWTPLYQRISGSPGPDPGFRRLIQVYPRFIRSIAQPIPPSAAQPGRAWGVYPATIEERGIWSAPPAGEKRAGEEIRFCPYCGVRVEPEDVYCYSCGERLRER